MDFYGASPDKIRTGAGLVADAAQNVEGLRRGVSVTTQELTASGWLGTASAKFLQAMTAWDKQMLIVRNDLEDIADRMGQNVVVYSAADQDVQSGMGRVDSLINTGSVDAKINADGSRNG
ncbi:WXG100 family type VII secretion target [Streptosporangium sp. NBC_01756]|uniref:WXG100 family type VII secretion target n=1 Tax=Streptosporangium sp. NBC_01756 TaxID=2975950 RepID=UPI002DD8CCE0|nr:WXG100 family type VII secretion target [Streptosporangium sp. NBC_01756]WSC88867.1 WXG100 family type VII secretion target [Streptosporangium sp. NBC_01756]